MSAGGWERPSPSLTKSSAQLLSELSVDLHALLHLVHHVPPQSDVTSLTTTLVFLDAVSANHPGKKNIIIDAPGEIVQEVIPGGAPDGAEGGMEEEG